MCIGCDGASLTRFTDKKRHQKKKSKKTEEDKKKSLIKTQIFQNLIDGNCETISYPKNVIDDINAENFITFIMQPLIWKLPVIVIHLTKSKTGSIEIEDANDINILFKTINQHQRFTARFLAADGNKSLDKLHKLSFNKYSDLIEKVVNGTISIDSFIEKVDMKMWFLPILDILHSAKSGRNNVMNNDIKLGDNTNIINRQALSEYLELKYDILKDITSIGRMNDEYPLNLFTFENAKIEFDKNQNSSSFYIIVYALILEIFRNPFIDIRSRLNLSKLSLFLLLLLYDGSYKLPSDTLLKKNKDSEKNCVWFDERIGIIQLINTMISVCICFNNDKTSYYLGMERLSSHCEEQFFGQYRDHF